MSGDTTKVMAPPDRAELVEDQLRFLRSGGTLSRSDWAEMGDEEKSVAEEAGVGFLLERAAVHNGGLSLAGHPPVLRLPLEGQLGVAFDRILEVLAKLGKVQVPEKCSPEVTLRIPQ